LKLRHKQALLRILVAAAGIAAVTCLHDFTPTSLIFWHYLFERLYYLPIVYTAIYFGWRGGLVASACAAICYIPHIRHAWHHTDYATDQYAEIVVFFLVGAGTGILADLGRKQRMALEATSEQLAKVNRELQDSFEQIKRADRLSAIGQLSASLAHEIRNPLASIDGAANLIESAQTSGEMRRNSLAIIRKEVQRLNRLLTSLLDFARPRKPEFQTVEPGHLIEAIVNLASAAARQKGIKLRKDVPAAAPAFECDPEQMKQVLLNLAINAVQAMAGPGEIVLSARQADNSVLIGVSDQGPGIDEENVDKVFNPFFTTKEAGTGLGLPVVHQIVTQHGGTVRAARNPGGGMTFSLIVPLRQRRPS
jgi:two-component system sensor histidine kinase HydH